MSLEDSYNDDFCAVNADAYVELVVVSEVLADIFILSASMDTYTAAPVEEAQFAVPVLTPTEPTTAIADSLEELYPYRNLTRNERRYIAR